jgi:transposase-like protein
MIDFKGHRFEKTIILTCVRWYLAYPLSYRDLEEMMEERGVRVDHSNIYRWVQKFTPQLEANFRNGKKRPVGKSWRMDETYIKVNGQWKVRFVDPKPSLNFRVGGWVPNRREETLDGLRVVF